MFLYHCNTTAKMPVSLILSNVEQLLIGTQAYHSIFLQDKDVRIIGQSTLNKTSVSILALAPPLC